MIPVYSTSLENYIIAPYLDSWLWVIPGLLFLWYFNRARPINNIGLDGWRYFFALVFIGSITFTLVQYIPYRILLNSLLIFFFISVALFYGARFHRMRLITQFLNILILIITFPLLTYIHLQYISEYIPEMYYKNNHLFNIFLASLTSLFLSQILSYPPIANWLFPHISDLLLKKCVEMDNSKDQEDKIAIITLENNKAYIAWLSEFFEKENLDIEKQIITIIPIMSGYRKGEDQKIRWNVKYPIDKDEDPNKSISLLIPRSEIVTFSKFNENFHASENS